MGAEVEVESLLQELTFIARVALGVVFLTAGTSKLLNRGTFKETILGLSIVPQVLMRPVTAILPIIEVLIGSALIVGLAVTVVSLVSAALLILFTAVLLIALNQDNPTDCGCFGPIFKSAINARLIARNLAFLLVSAVVLIGYDGYLSVESLVFGRETLSSQDLLFLLFLAFLVVTLIMSTLLVRQSILIMYPRNSRR